MSPGIVDFGSDHRCYIRSFLIVLLYILANVIQIPHIVFRCNQSVVDPSMHSNTHHNL